MASIIDFPDKPETATFDDGGEIIINNTTIRSGTALLDLETGAVLQFDRVDNVPWEHGQVVLTVVDWPGAICDLSPFYLHLDHVGRLWPDVSPPVVAACRQWIHWQRTRGGQPPPRPAERHTGEGEP
jgi:hypothetical protein